MSHCFKVVDEQHNDFVSQKDPSLSQFKQVILFTYWFIEKVWCMDSQLSAAFEMVLCRRTSRLTLPSTRLLRNMKIRKGPPTRVSFLCTAFTIGYVLSIALTYKRTHVMRHLKPRLQFPTSTPGDQFSSIFTTTTTQLPLLT